MKILFYLISALLVITALYILCLSFKSKKPLKFLFLNAFFGFLVLVMINLTKSFTGVVIPINQFTVLGSIILGIPSSVGFLILNFILK